MRHVCVCCTVRGCDSSRRMELVIMRLARKCCRLDGMSIRKLRLVGIYACAHGIRRQLVAVRIGENTVVRQFNSAGGITQLIRADLKAKTFKDFARSKLLRWLVSSACRMVGTWRRAPPVHGLVSAASAGRCGYRTLNIPMNSRK